MKRILLSVLLMMFILPVVAHADESYTVKRGDTLWKIANKFERGLDEIINANPQIENPDLIYPYQKITIPTISSIKNKEQKVIQLTNQERAKQGLSPLRADWELSRVARYKANDMRNNGYFSHTSPTYGSPFQMMKDFGLSYRRAGENIARGQRSASEVVNAWMNSAGHRANILNRDFTHIGVGWSEGNYWSQMFIGR